MHSLSPGECILVIISFPTQNYRGDTFMNHLIKDMSLPKTAIRFAAAGIACTGLLFTFKSCTSGKKKDASTQENTENYHADNDIAMTVRSIADALNVGEELDPKEYGFNGVLTDGQGKPLYTDLTGSPGLWDVSILNPHEASIRNIYLGDLLSEELRQYILSSLDLTDKDMLDNISYGDSENTEVYIYSIGRAEMRIITRTAKAVDGREGPLFNLILSAPSV